MSDCETDVATKRFKLLQQMERGSDITFMVGKVDKLPFKAHKNTLAIASDVFEEMFFGEFAFAVPDGDVIDVEDIEADVFMELLNYIYVRESISLTYSNSFDLLYAAKKYMIDSLMDKCVKFICNCVDENNCLDIFIKTEHFDIPVIEKNCFKYFCGNPFRYFEDIKFQEISGRGLGKIIKQPKFNCTTSDLKKMTRSWFDPFPGIASMYDYLEKHADLKEIDFENKTLLRLSFNWFGQVSLEKFSKMTLYVKKNAIHLYGIAVYTGIYDETQRPRDVVRVRIEDLNNSTVEPEPERTDKIIEITRLITAQPYATTTQHIMFEKTYMPSSSMRVTIDFGTKRKRPVNSSSVCTLAHNHRDATCILSRTGPMRNSCLAYLLYSE
jgi:hypothetical protein